MNDDSHDDEIIVHPALRKAAHAELDRWLGDCLVEVIAGFQTGHFGEVGTIRFRATSDDTRSLNVAVERVYEKDL